MLHELGIVPDPLSGAKHIQKPLTVTVRTAEHRPPTTPVYRATRRSTGTLMAPWRPGRVARPLLLWALACLAAAMRRGTVRPQSVYCIAFAWAEAGARMKVGKTRARESTGRFWKRRFGMGVGMGIAVDI